MAQGELTQKRIAFYGRFSSELQNENSVGDQLRVCAAFVAQRGGTIDRHMVFGDEGMSGAISQRPSLLRLQAAVKARCVDVIVVEDLSRLSRSRTDTSALIDLFDFYEVRLLGASDMTDTASAQSDAALMLQGFAAQQYLKALGDRTLRGLEGRFLAGGSTGALPFGYRSDRAAPDLPAIVSIHEEHAAIVRRIFALYVSGLGPNRIAHDLNRDGAPTPRKRRSIRADGWIYSAVREILRNPKYTGAWSFKARSWKRDPESRTKKSRARAEHQVMREQREHLRIIDDQTWNATQARFRTNASPRARPQAFNYLLSGLLFCDVCGGRMQVIGGQYRRYGCSARYRSQLCTTGLSVREDLTRERVLEVFRHRFFTPEALRFARECYIEGVRERQRGTTQRVDVTERKARKLRDEISNLVAALRHGASAALAAELHRCERELEAAKLEITVAAKAEAEPPRIPSDDELVQRVLSIDALVEQGDTHSARESLKLWLGHEGIRLVPTNGAYLARFEVYPMAVMLESNQPSAARESQGRLVYADLVAGAGFEPTTFGL